MYHLDFVEVLDRKNTNAILALKSAGNPSVNGIRPEGQHSRCRLPETSTLLQGWLCWMIVLQNVDLHNINIPNLTIGGLGQMCHGTVDEEEVDLAPHLT